MGEFSNYSLLTLELGKYEIKTFHFSKKLESPL